MIDWTAVGTNLFTAIPWWLFPLIIITAIFKAKIKKWEKDNKKKKYYKNRKQSNKNKYNKNDYKRNKAKNKTYNTNEYQKEKSDKYNNYKYSKNNNQKMSNKEKKEKGDKYEAYIAKFFREQGYYVWEHGKEKGKLDRGIDLFVKKENFIYFVQCKNWETWKITDKEVKATRTDVREYLKENKEFWQLIKNNQIKILYITAKECLNKGAYTYIKNNKDILEYQVIPMNNQL